MPLRINGFASGMDIDSMVTQIMKAQRAPVDKMKQKQQTLEWQRDNYRELNAKIVDFRNNKLFNYNLSSSLSVQKATVSGDTTAVTAKATNGAQAGILNIKVHELATASSINNSQLIAPDLPMDKKLADMVADGDIAGFTGNSITINGSTINFDPNTDTLSSLIQTINKDSVANVTAFYDSAKGHFSLFSKSTGKINGNGEITYSGDLLFTSLNLDPSKSPVIKSGTDSDIEINGMRTSRSSNVFTVNGVEITLLGKSNATGTSSINVTTDTDKIVDTIKSFITDYNDLLKVLNDKVSETRYRDFVPLTEDQKKDMKEDEVKNWEAKAKSGLLKGDSILKEAISKLRFDMTGPVKTGDPAVSTMIDSIGITSGQWYEGGKLTLKDESKLRAAIEKEPEKVIDLLTSKGDTANPDPLRGDVGVFQKIYDDLKWTLDSLSEKAGTSKYTSSIDNSLKDESVIGLQLRKLNSDIANKNRQLNALENRYYKQFTAMETAMNKLNSQSSSLAGFFG